VSGIKTKHQRDLQQKLSTVVAEYGSTLAGISVTGSSHLRLDFTKNGASTSVYTAGTPSDKRRALRNTIAQVRRLARGLR
jgi:hypothetical protein